MEELAQTIALQSRVQVLGNSTSRIKAVKDSAGPQGQQILTVVGGDGVHEAAA